MWPKCEGTKPKPKRSAERRKPEPYWLSKRLGTEFLRKKARLSTSGRDSSSTDLVPLDSEEPSRHLNFFQELQESGNKEYEEEKRQEKERQEKALGILTYLGQSAAEAQTSRPWYQQMPERDKTAAKDEKLKEKLDPLAEMERHLRKKKGSHKKKGEAKQREKGSTAARLAPPPSSSSLEQLRQERLRREQAERARAVSLLAQKAGTLQPRQEEEEVDERKRTYNSQFNPQLARKRVWELQ
ncbi:hypothetical protein JRQ81_005848 [Phrynocephalus forsythii]|uniref:Leukocyte receptor cluster member 1 n=1 Tax=Phrynocephalus forsythii TaxID=171643 RepID=A0A9Q0XHA6_9SAUR|nr:hypothetical protein JRQ81_005848 [Phrynocephalus forsythii]